jgi:nitrous oxide reductase accessory protein NosL
MNKKFVPFLVIFGLVVVIVSVFLLVASQKHMVVIKEGNIKKVPLKIEVGKYQDSDCGMVIDDLSYASEVVAPDGKTWFFHDHGGFVHWLSDKKFKDEAVIWAMSRDTKRFIDARKAFYSLTDTTPMGYGFGAYEHNASGRIDFKTMSLRMLRGETLNNPSIKKQLLGTVH